MKRKNIIYILTLTIIAFGLSACAPLKPAAPVKEGNPIKISVAASFYPLYFLAAEIGGDRAEVFSVTPAGTEPHDYELTPNEMMKIENSRLLVINGSGFEAWGEDIFKNIDPRETVAVRAGDGLPGDGSDPHFWLSPVLAGQMADNILAGFIKADPAGAAYYEIRAADLKNKLSALDAEYRAGLAGCAKKVIITAHAAFGHLAAAYGLEQKAIAGLSPESEPSPREMAAIASFAQANGVEYIFFESLVSPKLAETIAREAGAKTLVLNPLEGLTAEEIAAGQDYLSEMRRNLSNLRIALQCR